jgi:hypothetical protein
MALTEIFLSFLVSSCIACVLAVGSQMYKSKCTKVQIGCIKIERDVSLETDVETPKVELPTFKPPARASSLDATIHGDKR